MKEYKTLSKINGPLLFLKGVSGVGLNETAEIVLPSGEVRIGKVLEIDQDTSIVECLEGTEGIGTDARVRFFGKPFTVFVSKDMLGCTFDGRGNPIDVRPLAEKEVDINTPAINPLFRASPSEFIETGFSAIDGLLSIVRGQKIPIFSDAGLPHIKIMCQLAENLSRDVVVVFAAIGLTDDAAEYVSESFRQSGAMKNTVLFVNKAEDSVIERTITPRVALSVAEFFAWDCQKDVVVLMGDMTNYASALRELSSAKQEVPGRMGYPPYLYSDFASLYERAGKIRNKKGSITQLSFLTMPDGDITHPVPDLTGYITEGQILLSAELYRKGIFPPINLLPSLSRMMQHGIGKGKTREDHHDVSNQLYACYAEAKHIEDLKSIVGEDALSERDTQYISFKNAFEKQFLAHANHRSVNETLDIGWNMLKLVPKTDLTRINPAFLKKYGA